MNKLIYLISGVTTADFIVNILIGNKLRREAKNNFKLTIAVHVLLSALAVGTSIIQSGKIIYVVRKEALEHDNEGGK